MAGIRPVRHPLTPLGLLLLVTAAVACRQTAPEPEAPAGATVRTLDEVTFYEAYVPVDDGLRLYARVAGSGPDTVIIPGGMYLSKDLLPLAPGRTLIFYDPRGRGGSDVIRDPAAAGIEREVADLEAVRAYFGVDRFSVIGWSYMGALVALYAADHPEHVERVVQIGPLAPTSGTAAVFIDATVPPVDPAHLAHLARLREEGLPAVDPVGYCREWLTRELLPSIMAVREGVSRTSMDPCLYWNEWPGQVFATISRIMPQEWDYTAQARSIQAPVLTVHGTLDPSGPVEGGREWSNLVPNGRMIELEGVGHVAFLEAPERFFSEVDVFLSGGSN